LDLAHLGRRNYVGRWIGKAVDALVEGGDTPGDTEGEPAALPQRALSENYLRLLISPASPALTPRGSKIRCRISGPGGALPEREFSEKGIPRFDAWAERLF
jgi:hypothetical protein